VQSNFFFCVKLPLDPSGPFLRSSRIHLKAFVCLGVMRKAETQNDGKAGPLGETPCPLSGFISGDPLDTFLRLSSPLSKHVVVEGRTSPSSIYFPSCERDSPSLSRLRRDLFLQARRPYVSLGDRILNCILNIFVEGRSAQHD